jgi:spore maturation protein CgeB
LYVGQLFPGSTALHRCNALRSLGHDVHVIDSSLSFGMPGNTFVRIIHGLQFRSNPWMDWRGVHKCLFKALKAKWDILWIDKGLHIQPNALRRFKREQPNCKLISYSPDDMFNPANQTRCYLSAINIYDLIVTTKSYNVDEFKSVNAQDVFFVQKAYEPNVHQPIRLNDIEMKVWNCDVCFVGAREAEREQSIIQLAKSGVSIGLFGDWSHLDERFENVSCHKGFFADEAYAKALCAGKIGLCFLRKVNRDQQTARSIELPACGVFMLAERTDEHKALFKEESEAVFFSSDAELVEKVNYYLLHEDERQTIAHAGRQRCLKSGYSNADRLREVLSYLYD